MSYIAVKLKQYAMQRGLGCEVMVDDCSRYVEIKFFRMNRNDVIKRFETNLKWRTEREIVVETINAMERFWIDQTDRMIGMKKLAVPFDRIRVPSIKQVIFHDPATIVYWADGTRTVVKCQDGDIYDPEKGLAMAIYKKALGNKGNYCEVFKHWVPEEEVETLEQRKIDAANKIIQNAFEMWQREHQKDLEWQE